MQLQLTAVAYGDPRVPERLWKFAQVDADTGCWTWTGSRYGYQKRYAKAWFDGKTHKASRLFYTLLVRPIEPTEHAHHHCRNGLCVNPNPGHVEPLPQEQHWGHGHRDKTHCPQGHEYSPETTYVFPDGRRHCKICRRAAGRRSYAKSRKKEN